MVQRQGDSRLRSLAWAGMLSGPTRLSNAPRRGCCRAACRVSEQAAPANVAHNGQEAEEADEEGDAVDRPELAHIVCDGAWQNQVLAQDACTHEACETMSENLLTPIY